MGCGSSSPADDTNNNTQQKAKQQPKPSNTNNARKPPPGNTKQNQRNAANTNSANNAGNDERFELPELTQEPQTEDVEVAKSEPGYPPVKPAKEGRADIFTPSKMKNIDKHARETPPEKCNTYGELISYLTSVCSSDVEKARAILVWMGSQANEGGGAASSTDSESPLGFMALVKAEKASYASFFAVLCRHAHIPCVIVNGYAKSVAYEVGDTEEEVKKLVNSWNAVYVADGWRLVFPRWACRALVGHSTGAYTKVETKGKAVREKEEQSEGTVVLRLNDFFFLTDPEEFAHFAHPLESRWQLLPRPWSLQTFIDVPQCYPPFFKEKVQIQSKFNCRLKAKLGVCNVEVSCEDPKDFNMDYELFYNNKESGKEISSSLQLNSFILLDRSNSKWNFTVRCPQEGVYKLRLLGGKGYETSMCDFKIFCNAVYDEVTPYPCNPGRVGYGPSLTTEQAGVKATSQRDGIVKFSAHRTVSFSFTLTREVVVKAELVHSTLSKEEIASYLRETSGHRKYDVMVTIPEPGEYALQLYAQQKNENINKNICNYLLTSSDGRKRRFRQYENAFEKNTRNNVQSMSKTKGTREKDIGDLSKAIERFEALDLEDKGDLAAAHDALELKKVQKELKDAINRRHLATLEKATVLGNESRFKEKVTHLIQEAEEVRDHLKKLDRISHEVLAMKQPTISELRSYKDPPKIIIDIMRAVFLMLGENRVYVEYWEDLQVLMGKTGKDSMLRRVRNFDTHFLKPEASAEVTKILNEHEEHDARVASAGAGTFYVWLRDVSALKDSDGGGRGGGSGGRSGQADEEQGGRAGEQNRSSG